MRNIQKANYLGMAALMLLFTSCSQERSTVTGWEYNNEKNGGFEVVPYAEQETGPGLVLIEGGTFTMGKVQDDVMFENNNTPIRTTVSSFYMDESEISNVNYLEYLYWLTRVFGTDYPEVYKKALPDTLVWRKKLAYNEPFIEHYLRHPAYHQYPVVGVNWLQANDFCVWRTDRVNEMILIREGILKLNPNQINDDNFNLDAYLAGQYEGLVKNNLQDYDPNKDTRKVRMEDGIFLPRYRLPTEAEWEYAAYGLIGNSVSERVVERRIYPWNGSQTRNSESGFTGEMYANFKRDKGDNMGVAGQLNDNADITSPVLAYWPNDFGLYNMAGNVSEWVMDVYRPMGNENTALGTDGFRQFTGNVYKTQERDEEGAIAEKDSLGRIKYRDVKPEENVNRRNYKTADNISFLDGDHESGVYYKEEENNTPMYNYGKASLINDKVKIYKGGSWKDRAYYMNPGTKRFLEEDQSTEFIGFRCAMHRVGSPTGF
jgi:gliding motility-associated lipoprotein GldJ